MRALLFAWIGFGLMCCITPELRAQNLPDSRFRPVKSQQEEKQSGPSEAMGQQLVKEALKYIGAPYAFGGASLKTGIDTSHFVSAIYRIVGVELPSPPVHYQERAGSIVHWRKGTAERGGVKVVFKEATPSLDRLQAGDRLIFQTSVNRNYDGNHHTGIYIGKYRSMRHAYIHASSSRGVCVSELKPNTMEWNRYRYALRDVPAQPDADKSDEKK